MSKATLMNLTRLSGRTLFALCLMALGAVLSTVGMAVATDNDRSTSDVIGAAMVVPYDGFLMLDSAPMSGTRALYFELYDAPSGGTAVWAEEQSVTFYNGRFAVGLGSGTQDSSVNGGTSLAEVVNDGEQLYLAIQIEDQTAGCTPVAPATTCYVALSGRQAIEPVPYASWSAASADFGVGGALRVDGDSRLGDDAADTTTVHGQLRLQDELAITDARGRRHVMRGSVNGENGGTGVALRPLDSGTAAGDPLFQVLSHSGDLRLEVESDDKIYTDGDLLVGRDLRVQGRFTENIRLADDLDIFNVDVINGFNDIRWRANAGDTADDMRLTSSGHLEVLNNLEVDGNVTLNNASSDTTTINGRLRVNGGFANFYVNTYSVDVSGDGTNNAVRGRANIGTTSNRICMLQDFTIVDHDSDDLSSCRIVPSGSGAIYHLDAFARGGSGTYTYCEAVCFGW